MHKGLLIALIALICTAGYGWVMNIVKLFGALDGGLTAMFIARIVGAFAVPFGAVLGFF